MACFRLSVRCAWMCLSAAPCLSAQTVMWSAPSVSGWSVPPAGLFIHRGFIARSRDPDPGPVVGKGLIGQWIRLQIQNFQNGP
jgi:hypothetical protein